MRQDTTSALAGLASFAKLQDLLAARSHEGCAEGTMTFEAFEVELGHAVRGLENELKAADLARYDVDAECCDGLWPGVAQAPEQQPKTYLSASGTHCGGPEPVPSGRGRQVYLSPRAACRGSSGRYTPVLARQVTYLMVT